MLDDLKTQFRQLSIELNVIVLACFLQSLNCIMCGCSNPGVGQFAKKEDTSWWMEDANFPSGSQSVQRASGWCWAACIETAVNALIPNSVTLQEYLATRVFGGIMDEGATTSQIAKAIDGATFVYNFEQGKGVLYYTIHAYEPSDGVDLSIKDFIRSAASKNVMVIAALEHHAVVIGSVTAYGGKITTLSVWDPWPRKGSRSIPSSALIDTTSPDHLRGYVMIEVREHMGYR